MVLSTLRNEGIRLAKGTFIALNDADDLSENTRFEKQIAVFTSQPNVAVCGSWILNFGDNIESYVFQAPQNPIDIKLTFCLTIVWLILLRCLEKVVWKTYHIRKNLFLLKIINYGAK